MRACPPDVMADIERQTPFSDAEEALLAEIPFVCLLLLLFHCSVSDSSFFCSFFSFVVGGTSAIGGV